MRFTPHHITELPPHEIFVFGSNLAGRHGAGAAKLALHNFGALYGRGTGRMGQSYGIATKDRAIQTLPIWKIEQQIPDFFAHCRSKPNETFLVTEIGCGLAGYTPGDIAPLFREAPSNVILPESFHKIISSLNGIIQ